MASGKGRDKELAELAETVLEKLKKEVEEGLKLSITKGGEEGWSKILVSCRYLEEQLRVYSKREGVVVAESVETLGVDLRTRTKQLGAKEKARRK